MSLIFQSPLPRGSHCNAARLPHSEPTRSFSPLYLGVLTATTESTPKDPQAMTFQSPLPRGSHCNLTAKPGPCAPVAFQSPLPRGSHCNFAKPWKRPRLSSFSPLYLGVLTATRILDIQWVGLLNFQSPLPRGSHCNPRGGTFLPAPKLFQSPLPRGSHCNREAYWQRHLSFTFSPLYLGVLTATR